MEPRTARYRELRAQLGLTKAELARTAGRSVGSIERYGHSGASAVVPPQEVIERLEAALLSRLKQIALAAGHDLRPRAAA
ncbi:MAG: hypothetical protein DI565_12865 [Ancylobacter novellus]|uniref:HTH cro/C1-type domain-containing protein n=1 Tax=Ancylobacter novellus TaxID=921 RepID=A0A2W5KHH5_ANCNO|nr:MAG: hypothetical protein DI565_12865 [Ancylobacter novellus]